MQYRYDLRAAGGKMERKRRAASSGTQPERYAAEPQPAAGATAVNRKKSARDERVLCGVERVALRGEQSRRAARGAKQTARWSRRFTK